MPQLKMQLHEAPNLWFNVRFTLVSQVLFPLFTNWPKNQTPLRLHISMLEAKQKVVQDIKNQIFLFYARMYSYQLRSQRSYSLLPHSLKRKSKGKKKNVFLVCLILQNKTAIVVKISMMTKHHYTTFCNYFKIG